MDPQFSLELQSRSQAMPFWAWTQWSEGPGLHAGESVGWSSGEPELNPNPSSLFYMLCDTEQHLYLPKAFFLYLENGANKDLLNPFHQGHKNQTWSWIPECVLNGRVTGSDESSQDWLTGLASSDCDPPWVLKAGEDLRLPDEKTRRPVQFEFQINTGYLFST